MKTSQCPAMAKAPKWGAILRAYQRTHREAADWGGRNPVGCRWFRLTMDSIQSFHLAVA